MPAVDAKPDAVADADAGTDADAGADADSDADADADADALAAFGVTTVIVVAGHGVEGGLENSANHSACRTCREI